MDETVNKFLLAGDKFMPEMHLRCPGFTYSACEPSSKSKERIQKFKEEQFLIKYCMIKHLIFLKVLNMVDIKEVFLQWFINFLVEILLVEKLKMRICLIKN